MLPFPRRIRRAPHSPDIPSAPKENIAPAAFFDHTLCNFVMLVFVAVPGQLGTVFVPLKMSADPDSGNLSDKCNTKIVPAAVILHGADALYLHSDRIITLTLSIYQIIVGFQYTEDKIPLSAS